MSLLEELTRGHEREFLHSASFHATLTLLSRLLPLMIDGIAADAWKNERKLWELQDSIAKNPFPLYPYQEETKL